MNTNTKFIAKQLRRNLIAAAIFALTIMGMACSMLGNFNRNTAANLIEKDNRYLEAATMTIDIGARLTNAGANTPQLSADDTEAAAIVRARADFGTRQPQILVAEELGYIKLYFENTQLRNPGMGETNYRTDLKIWSFRARAEITDKGRKLWSDLNLNVDEESLPLAVRSQLTITGLKDENQNMKSADFTYKWEPNELGKAFDPSSEEFQKLPVDLQESLKKTQHNMFGGGRDNTMNFQAIRNGKAYFQKFDDGWRLGQLYFM